jgi:hypothetical protein
VTLILVCLTSGLVCLTALAIHAARTEIAEAEEGQRIARALGRYNYRTNDWRPF